MKNIGRDKKSYLCTLCGYQAPKWLGRCPQCGEWNTLEEERVGKVTRAQGPTSAIQAITDLEGLKDERLLTQMEELDRILGGGIVRGSLILLGGDPGIGKSTLTLQVLDSLTKQGHKGLYISGEESLAQLRMRAQRLGALQDQLFVMGITSIEEVEGSVASVRPSLVIVDSVQTTYSESLNSPPGSIAQLREVTARTLRFAKEMGVAVCLVGHVTKEGVIAGPRLLEHMVDTVLYLEGEGHQPFRALRVTKNRFGPTFEMAIFEMRDKGLWPVLNPSLLFLRERPKGVSGTVVTPHMAGSRPLLLEVQALVTHSSQPMPRRTFLGVDSQRVSLVAAVLEKRLGISLNSKDLFLNVVGGIKVQDTAADLAIATSILSSYMDVPVTDDVAVFGEIGLAGEIRSVNNAEARVREAKGLGFRGIVLPRQNLMELKDKRDMLMIGANDLPELMKALFHKTPRGNR